MASIIRLKRNNSAGNAPSSLVAGEVALNTNDKRLYSSDGSAIFEVGINPHQLSVGTGGLSVGNGAFTLPTGDGTANQILQTDGAGNISFQTFIPASNTVTIQTSTTVADVTTQMSALTSESKVVANPQGFISLTSQNNDTIKLPYFGPAIDGVPVFIDLRNVGNVANAYLQSTFQTKAQALTANTAQNSLILDRVQVANLNSSLATLDGGTF